MTRRNFRIAKSWYSHGLNAVVIFHTDRGFYCGYVGVPKDHPVLSTHEDRLQDIEVHGGITYVGNSENYPEPNRDYKWYFGFDCAHSGDRPADSYVNAMSEDLRNFYTNPDSVFRDLDYVTNECNKLAEQLANIAMSGTTTKKISGE